MRPSLSRPIVALLVAVFLVVGVPAPDLVHAKDAPLDKPLTPDPAIAVRRTLPNGFTYWIRPHNIPGRVVELGLHVRVGSLDEREEERGLAHFLEHMAFNGSTNFAPGEVVKFFESQGLTFGQHQNANTGYDRTKYFLSLPTNDPKIVQKGLTFFADVAYGLTLTAKEIDAERPVILEELRARSGADTRIQSQQMQALAPDALIAERAPIGLESVIKKAGPAQFRALYERGYRPERTTLLVCGDVDAKVVDAMVMKLFAGWKGKGEAVPQPATGLAKKGTLRTKVLTDPESQGAQIVFLRHAPSRPERTVRDTRESLVTICALVGAQLRWQRLTQQSSDIEGLSVGTEDVAGDDALAIAVIAGDADGWRPLTTKLIHEMRRIKQNGFSAEELAGVKSIITAQVGRMVQAEDTWNAKKQLEEMFDAVHDRNTPVSGRSMLPLLDQLLPQVTLAEVNAEFAARWGLEDGLLVARMPTGTAGGPTAETLAAAVKTALSEPLETATGEGAGKADLGAVPTPGKVKTTRAVPGWRAEALLFENGVIARYRGMRTPGHVTVRISLLAGIVEETAADRGIMQAAVIPLSAGSFASRTNSSSRLSQHALGIQAKIDGGLEGDRVVITVEGAPASITPALQLVHHVLKAPKVEGPALKRWKRSVLRALDNVDTAVDVQAHNRSRALLSDGDVRLGPLSRARVEAITVEDAQARIDAAVRTAPIQVAIVGDASAAQARQWAATWLGSLPARPPLAPALQKARRVAQGKLPASETLEIDTVTDKAVVRLAWRGGSRGDTPARAILFHAAMILTARLNAEVREKRGLTYTASAGYDEGWFDGAAALVISFTADPSKAVEASKVAKAIVKDLRDKGPTAEEVQVTKSKVNHLLQRLDSSPAFWAHFLGSIEADGRVEQDAGNWVREMMTVSGPRIQAILQKFVIPENLAEVIATPRSKPK